MAANDQSDSSEFYELITDGGKSIYVLKKDLTENDWSVIERVGQNILKSIEKTSRPQMILDLSELDYMGSAMVALLLRIWKQVNAQEGTLVFVTQEENVYEILKLAGLSKLWTICDSREEAARHLVTPLEKTGRTLSPLLVIAALIATAVGAGAYLLLHLETTPLDDATLGKLQVAGSIVGMTLTAWVLKSTAGTARFLALLLFLLASAVLSLGFLDYRIPGLGNFEPAKELPANSALDVELGESESSDEPPAEPFGEETEQKPQADDDAETPSENDPSSSGIDAKTEQGTP